MIKRLLQKQKEHLDAFYDAVDTVSLENAFQEISQVKGVLFLTGVGKSGFVAQKVAATLMSTGSKAFFLPPIDALHGDLGMVSKEDAVIILSKSGQTEELLQLLPFVRNKGARTIAMTSHEESRLAKSCSLHIYLPCSKELCPFDLAPTTSTEIQLLVGDLLAIYLMEKKQFGVEEYVKNHPGGSIGKRISMRVSDLMKKNAEVPLCKGECSLEEVLHEFTEKRCGCLIVVDQQRHLQGIFTDGDLRRALQKSGGNVLQEKLENLMTKKPRAISSKAAAVEAMELMESDQNHPIMVLPVLENEEVVGIIKMHDIIQSGL